MYDNFMVGDEVCMIMIHVNGYIYEKVIDGIIKEVGDSFLEVTSLKNLDEIKFRNGDLFTKDVDGKKYFLYTKKQEAESVLKRMREEYDFKEEVFDMVKKASTKQLETIFSYLVAERDRERYENTDRK